LLFPSLVGEEFCGCQLAKWLLLTGLGQFGAAVLATPIRRPRFGAEPIRRRDVSTIVIANLLCEKNVFLKYLKVILQRMFAS